MLNSKAKYLLFSEKDRMSLSLTETEIVFLKTGKILLSDENETWLVHGGEMFILAPGITYAIDIPEEATVFLFQIYDWASLSAWISSERLIAEKGRVFSAFTPLEINEVICLYLQNYLFSIRSGMVDPGYQRVKIMELFYYLKCYYTKEQLAAFFFPLLNENILFTRFVLDNYTKVKTVREFAALNHQSVSVFDKTFRQVFHESPYQWMKDRRLKQIVHEIKYTSKTFKEISYEYGFSTPSQLSDFCKKHHGQSPGMIRKSVLITEG